MRRVGPLPSPRAQQVPLPAPAQQRLQQEPLRTAIKQTRPELAQHRRIEPRVGQLQAQHVLPVDPAPHRVRGLPIGESLSILKDADQCQPPGSQSWLPVRGEAVNEQLVNEELTEFVGEAEVGVALREGGMGHPRGLSGNRPEGLWPKNDGPRGGVGCSLSPYQPRPRLRQQYQNCGRATIIWRGLWGDPPGLRAAAEVLRARSQLPG